MGRLQNEMDDQARNHRADMAKKDHEIDFLTKKNEELLEIKIAMDKDLAAYGTLLEGEESRLGMSMTGEADLTDGGRGTKRKRLMETTEEYSGVNVTTTFTQPGVFLIEPLDEENLKCIKVGVGDSVCYYLCSVSSGEEHRGQRGIAERLHAEIHLCR